MLKPLWVLYNKMSHSPIDSSTIVPPVVRALTEVFLVAENLAMVSVRDLYIFSITLTIFALYQPYMLVALYRVLHFDVIWLVGLRLFKLTKH